MNDRRHIVHAHRIARVGCRDDARVEKDGEQFNEHVHPEERDDFFSSYRGVLASDVVDHDGGHENGHDMHETCRWLGQ